MVMVFRCDGSPVVDQRCAKSSRRVIGSIKHLGKGWDGRRDGFPRRPGTAVKGGGAHRRGGCSA
jgi:hypothetical protein